jgi:hypothetical protein
MTEAEFQKLVVALCKALGLLWHHCANARTCTGDRGLPDLVVAGPAGILLVELKSEDGVTTGDQDWWLWQAGGFGRLWRPSDLASGLVRKELGALVCES